MKDRIEDFIRNNRKEFDIDSPSPEIWKGIERELGKGKRIQLFRYMGIAATFIVLIAAAYVIGLQRGGNELNQDLFANQEAYNNFMEASNYYNSTINTKLVQVEELGIKDDVSSDLEQLDEIYNELREEMINSNYKDNEMIINLMIKNYKTKIELLERIIQKTQDSQLSKINKNETINI